MCVYLIDPYNIVCVCVCVCVCSVVSDSVAHQAPLSMEFSQQGFWSGLPFPTPHEFHDPGIKPVSLTYPALASSISCIGRPILYQLYHLGSTQIILLSTLFTFKKSNALHPLPCRGWRKKIFWVEWQLSGKIFLKNTTNQKIQKMMVLVRNLNVPGGRDPLGRDNYFYLRALYV